MINRMIWIHSAAKKSKMITIFFVFLALACCNQSKSREEGGDLAMARSSRTRIALASVPSADLATAVKANNAFALDLYARLCASAATQNLITSPLSASLALSMAYAGALDTTATQMKTALHHEAAAGTIFSGQNALSQTLGALAEDALEADTQSARNSGAEPPSSSNYQLHVVNSVWGEQSYSWNAPFLDILAENYGTGVHQQDFKNDFDHTRSLINSWVSSATANKINNLLPENSLDQTTRMVLVNAVHLKFPWDHTFNASDTASASFTTAAGGTVSASFMNRTARMSYVDDGKAQIVSLPLAGGRLAVVIALPHGDLAAYEAGLTVSSAGVSPPTASALVQLSLPKVTFTSASLSLKTALTAMGMAAAFDRNSANFNGMCTTPPNDERLYIGDVLQKATITMQEEGVEAAAATAVIMVGTTSAPQPITPIPMNVNRPYVVSIVDVTTGALLFLGHVVDPTAAGGE